MADNGVLSTPPSTPPHTTSSASSDITNFDIAAHYEALLNSNPSLTPPIAAIESLLHLLAASPLRTVSETLSLLSTASNKLLASQSNPIPVSAGTDLFQRYLITSFNQTPLSSQSGSDFTSLRNQLISNSKLFVARAKQARGKIADYALPLLGGMRGECKTTVITYGESRVVGEVLRSAAEKGAWFNVIHVQPSTSHVTGHKVKGAEQQIANLRKSGVSVATIPLEQLSYVLSSLPTHPETRSSESTFFLLGTSAVLENGAVVSQMGCSLIASIAKVHAVPLYVATESYKFVRQFPIGFGARDLEKMGYPQRTLMFRITEDSEGARSNAESLEVKVEGLVDITPPALIAGLVTENGVMTPDAVAEELIKLWF